MGWNNLIWSNVIILGMSIKQLVTQHIPFLNIYIAAISLGACVWLRWTFIKGYCNNTHCAFSLPHLTLRTQLNTVLAAGVSCSQTAITDVEYLTFWSPLAIGITLSVAASCSRFTSCQSRPCVSTTGFCKNADFLKNMLYYGQLYEKSFANTTLSDGNLHGLLFIFWYSSN